MNREKIKSKARMPLVFFPHSPLFHKHLVTSCTKQKIKADKDIGKIFVMCRGGKEKGSGTSPLSPHTAPDEGYGPCSGGSEEKWTKPREVRDGGGPRTQSSSPKSSMCGRGRMGKVRRFKDGAAK